MVWAQWALVPVSCACAAGPDHRALGNPLCLFSRLVNLEVQGKSQYLFKQMLSLGSCDTKSRGSLQGLLAKVPTMEVLFHRALRR